MRERNSVSRKPTYEELERRVRKLEEQLAERKRVEDALIRTRRRLNTVFDFVAYPLVVLSLEQRVRYLNAGFVSLFGWTQEEMEGKRIPFVPRDVMREAQEDIEKIIEEKSQLRRETKRITRTGRILDVVIRIAYYHESEYEPAGLLMIFRDVTEQKRIARINETILRISTALPEHPDLEELLDFVDSEVMRNLETEGSVAILLDEEKQELFVLGAAYDDSATERRVKEIRFGMNELVAGEVIRTGKPVIVSDTSENAELHRERDRKLGYRTRNLALVPLRTSDRITGVLCALNKKEGSFDQRDIELLSTIAGTVALSVENARVNSQLKTAYEEVRGLNRAKDKVIHHLSHELKTPVSILGGSLKILERTLSAVPRNTWEQNIERMKRNLDRIVEIQYEVSDIMRDRHYRAYDLLSVLLEECKDELAVLVEEESQNGKLAERIRKKIDILFGENQAEAEKIYFHDFVKQRLEILRASFSFRTITIGEEFEKAPPVLMPRDTLQKVVDGIIRNAIENTPDEGKVELVVRQKGKGTLFVVRDYGVGIVKEAQQRIFEGFFSTQQTSDYRTGKPFEFNAGGKGADLLRMKIFSERFNFTINMESSRCKFIPGEEDSCPGTISECRFCTTREDCFASGGTTFTLYFPPAKTTSE
ncbi:MAG: histidine kinase [Deltaproteobacteria bacterium]|nr:MAG: histidine kinase [Deltaproteobacteria bacterium]